MFFVPGGLQRLAYEGGTRNYVITGKTCKIQELQPADARSPGDTLSYNVSRPSYHLKKCLASESF